LITEFTQQQPATKLMLPRPVFTNMIVFCIQAKLRLSVGCRVAMRTICGR